MPSVSFAQDDDGDYAAVVRSFFDKSESDTFRLGKMRSIADTCASVERLKEYSKVFLELSERDRQMRNMAHAYLFVGYATARSGDLNKGLEYCFTGLRYADSLDITDAKVLLQLNISTFLDGINDFEGSFDYLQKAEKTAEEAHDYSTLVDIYYNLAISYIQEELFETSIECFEKDIDAALRAGKANTTDQELCIQSLLVRNAFKLHDTLSIINLIDSVNGLMWRLKDVDEAGGVVNFCNTMLMCNLDAIDFNPVKKEEYLGYCRQYLDNMKIAIDTGDIKPVEETMYKPCKAMYLTARGDLRQARKMLAAGTETSGSPDYAQALFYYYKTVGDYKNADHFFWKLYRTSYKVHSLETAIHYEKSAVRDAYEKRMDELKSDAERRDHEFAESNEFSRIWRNGVLIVLGIVISIIIVVFINLKERSTINQKLRQSNDELLMANEELNVQREEILSQTDEIQQQSHVIAAQRDDLSTTNAHLLTSINIARDIQRAIVMSPEKLSETVGESFVYWKPLNIVSGDFYWAARIGEKAYTVVADCTGHGVPGALLSMYGISMLNDIVWRNPHATAAQILETLKSTFNKSFVIEDKNFLDGIDMAFIIIDRQNMRVNYSGAKRPLLAIDGGTIREFKPDKISIGNNIMRKNDTFTDHTFPVRKGEMLYAFSDGIADQFGSDDCMTKFGVKQLHTILAEASFLDLPTQRSIVESVVENWCTGAYLAGLADAEVPQLDDQLLVGIRI